MVVDEPIIVKNHCRNSPRAALSGYPMFTYSEWSRRKFGLLVVEVVAFTRMYILYNYMHTLGSKMV
jgi:hypothetical protein